jgi:hypothetical protein
MDKLLEALTKLVPAGVAIGIVAFLYLVLLFKRASDRFIDLSQKQSEFLKDRIEIVDKTSVIFTRTIEQQEKEIRKLREDLESVNVSLEQTRLSVTDRSVEEIKSLAGTVRTVLSLQEATLDLMATGGSDSRSRQTVLVERSRAVSRSFDSEIPNLLEKRDLSRYIVLASRLDGVEALVAGLKSLGLAASAYEHPSPVQDDYLNEGDHEAIWVGRKVPPGIVLSSIRVARKRWPFLRYIHISGDLSDTPPEEVHSQLYFGGSTQSARRYGLRPWTDAEIEALEASTPEEVHSSIRSHYAAAEIASA